jgi:hypothetical protein
VIVLTSHTNDDQFRVNDLPRHIVSALVAEDRCPMCLENLRALRCVACSWDAGPWVAASRADHERSMNNREG